MSDGPTVGIPLGWQLRVVVGDIVWVVDGLQEGF